MTSIASVPKSIHLYTALTEHLGQRMFETTFKNLDDTLRKDAGCATEMDYIEQTSWVLFLKYLDDFEADREATAKLSGQRYKRILADEYAWHVWAAPKRADCG